MLIEKANPNQITDGILNMISKAWIAVLISMGRKLNLQIFLAKFHAHLASKKFA